MIFPLVSNERIGETVKNFVKTNHFPHAILIEGEAGLGKRTLCSFIAAAAVCEDGENAPCGQCKGCEMLKAGTHPDVSVTTLQDKKKSITVAQIRQARADAFIKPQSSPRRVMIIEQAHTLNEQSQNALLKVLEEPPGQTVFILLAENKSALLQTVLSRCVTLSLTAPPTEAAFAFLKKQNPKAEDEAIFAALWAARNNIGRAGALLKKKSFSKAYTAAKEFLEIYMNGGRKYDLLKITARMDKDRALANEFLKELKFAVNSNLQRSANNVVTLLRLVKLNDLITQKSPLLTTNINLALFFSGFICNL